MYPSGGRHYSISWASAGNTAKSLALLGLTMGLGRQIDNTPRSKYAYVPGSNKGYEGK